MATEGFNRGNTGPGRRRDLGLMPGASAGEGTTGNVIPRGTTQASIRRGQALLRMMNDRLPGGQEFSRGTTEAGRRRNFAMMAGIQDAIPAFSVKLLTASKAMPITLDYDVEFDSAEYDPAGMWIPSDSVECKSTGSYELVFSLNVDSYISPVTIRTLVNGTEATTDTFSAGATLFEATNTVSLTIGDIVVLRRNPESGSGFQNLNSGTWTITKL